MSALHKGYLILVISTFVIYTLQDADPAFLATYDKYLAECIKETGVTEDYVTKVWNENHFPNDDKLKCYFKCMSLKLGMMTDAGALIDDGIKKVQIQFNDAATNEEIIQECGGIKGSDLCDTAFKLTACIKAAQLD